MPPIEESGLNQDAVLWPAGGFDDSGQPTVGEPVAILCRWLTTRRQSISPTGEPIAISADLTTDRLLPLGSHVWKGKLADYNDAAANEVMVVLTQGETPDIKGRAFLYEAGLGYLRTGPGSAPMASPRKARGKRAGKGKRGQGS